MTSLSRPNLFVFRPSFLPCTPSPPAHARVLLLKQFLPSSYAQRHGEKKEKKEEEEEQKQATPSWFSLCNGVTCVNLARYCLCKRKDEELGNGFVPLCPEGSSLDSAVKRSLSSPSPMGTPTVAPPRPAAGEVLVAAAWTPVAVPIVSRRTLTFSDFGSKEDSFFDSQVWLESDCEDEFFSVKGDFTPSRGNTPVHDGFFVSTPRRITAFFKDETLGSIPEPTPAGGKKKLYELFQESFRGGQSVNGDSKFSNNPTNPARGISGASGANSVHSSKRAARGGSKIIEEKHVTPFPDCLLRLVSCGGSSKRRREMTPAIAIHG